MASTVASFGCRDSIVAGLIAGYLIRCLMVRWVMIPCIVSNVPATMTTLLGAGGLGSIIGLICLLVVAPLARCLTATIRWAIQWTIVDSSAVVSPYCPVVAAFLWGCLSCASSKVGYYHSIHLPLILIELETMDNHNNNGRGGGGCFLGAVDELTLVLVCAGVCAAKVISTSTTIADRELCRRGLWINLLFGDFVEVCYPYMEQSIWINLSGHLASGLSCALLVSDYHYHQNNMSNTNNSTTPLIVLPSLLPPASSSSLPSSLAYLPWIASVILAGDYWYAMLRASIVAFGIPFLTTVLVIAVTTTTANNNKGTSAGSHKEDHHHPVPPSEGLCKKRE